MSTTAGALDRATLDSKDRAELQTIAQAMGAKPGSRLRKAEIVDMILDLAGGSSSSSSSGSRSNGRADKSKDSPKESSSKGASSKSSSAKGAAKDGDSKDGDSKDGDSSSAAGDVSLFDADPGTGSSDDDETAGSFGIRSRGRRDGAKTGDNSAKSKSSSESYSSESYSSDADSNDSGAKDTESKSADSDSDDNDSDDNDSEDNGSGDKRSDSKGSESKGSESKGSSGKGSDDSKSRDGGSNRDRGRGRNDGDGDRNRGRDGQNRDGQNSGGQNRDGKNRDGQNSGGQNRDGQNRDGQNRGGQNRDGQRGGRNRDGQNNDGQNRDGGRNNRGDRNNNNRNNNNNDQTEAGNRKRRRRGGGRDRDDENVPPWDGEPVEVEGFLDLRSDGYGFLRVSGSLATDNDVYVPVKTVRTHGLRRGDLLKGKSRPANKNEKNPALLELEAVNGGPVEKAKDRPRFEDLTPLFPDDKLRLERPDDAGNMTTRIIDLISPVGKGQRGLIVSPPKAGKTTIVKEIVRSIEVNNPDVKVLVLLVDERPEEVTDMKRWLVRGEVIASTFDRPSDEHTAVAEMTIERAKRMVEFGDDVVIVLDGITRLARAYNLAAPSTGRIMSGGVDSGALYPPKRFFGAARNVEEGGSLTILATALIETGSKMDEVIFEEFKGTGNMELRLDRRTAERRIYPAIDVDASSTRHEELLFDRAELNQVWKLRRVLTGMANDEDNGRGNAAGLELLIDRLKTFATNAAFLDEVARGPVG